MVTTILTILISGSLIVGLVSYGIGLIKVPNFWVAALGLTCFFFAAVIFGLAVSILLLPKAWQAPILGAIVGISLLVFGWNFWQHWKTNSEINQRVTHIIQEWCSPRGWKPGDKVPLKLGESISCGDGRIEFGQSGMDPLLIFEFSLGTFRGPGVNSKAIGEWTRKLEKEQNSKPPPVRVSSQNIESTSGLPAYSVSAEILVFINKEPVQVRGQLENFFKILEEWKSQIPTEFIR